MSKETYIVTLRAIPGWNTPGIQRMRAALKCLLRGFGLRCESIVQTPEPPSRLNIALNAATAKHGETAVVLGSELRKQG